MDIKPTQRKGPLGDGMHGEVRSSHLDSISIRSIGESWAEDVQGCCQFPCGVFNHQHGQSIAAIAGVSFSIHVNHSVAVNVIPYLMISRNEHSVLRAFTNQYKLLNGSIAIHVSKVNGPWRSPWVEHVRGLAADVVVIVPPTGNGVSRHVAGQCCRIAVRVPWIRNQEMSSKVKIVIKNGGVGERENSIVVIAIPTCWAIVLN